MHNNCPDMTDMDSDFSDIDKIFNSEAVAILQHYFNDFVSTLIFLKREM